MHPRATNLQRRTRDVHEPGFELAGVPLPVTNTQESRSTGSPYCLRWARLCMSRPDPKSWRSPCKKKRFRLDAGNNLWATVARPGGILLPRFLGRKVDYVVGGAHQHLAVDWNSLPLPVDKFFIVHPVPPDMSHAPSTVSGCRGAKTGSHDDEENHSSSENQKCSLHRKVTAVCPTAWR